jgi:hypothetical protein
MLQKQLWAQEPQLWAQETQLWAQEPNSETKQHMKYVSSSPRSMSSREQCLLLLQQLTNWHPAMSMTWWCIRHLGDGADEVRRGLAAAPQAAGVPEAEGALCGKQPSPICQLQQSRQHLTPQVRAPLTPQLNTPVWHSQSLSIPGC